VGCSTTLYVVKEGVQINFHPNESNVQNGNVNFLEESIIYLKYLVPSRSDSIPLVVLNLIKA
jgi:hypothetical protein